MVGMAKLVIAPDCGSGGRGFESLYSPFPYREFFFYLELSSDIGPSPSGKAQDFDSCSRQFESGWPSFGILAQVVEHLTFNQVVRGSSPRCLSNDMVCKDHKKKSSSTTFFCGVKLPLFTSSIDIILSFYVTQYTASKKLLGLLKIFVYSVFNLVFS